MAERDLPLNLYQSLIAAGVGAVTFPAILGFNQVAIFKPLRLSTRLPLLLAATVGGASVTTAAVAASYVVAHIYPLAGTIFPNLVRNETANPLLGTPELIASSIISLVLYRSLGGRFSSVLPSHLCAPGAFARQWIPANSINYANSTEKNIIQLFGREHGCHSCGNRKVSDFVADHQPPSKVFKLSNGGQRFYPQCRKCSGLQGGYLAGTNSTVNSAAHLVQHPFSLRLYHVFLPLPLAFVFMKSHLLFSNKTEDNETKHLEKTSNDELKQETAINEVLPDIQQPQLPNFFSSFPILIIWNKIMSFFDSLPPVTEFHLTLWAFSIFAALGSCR